LVTGTGSRAIPHDVQEVEGGTAASPHHSVSAKIIKTSKNAKTLFFGGWGAQ